MSPWASGDSLTPSTLNLKQASASTLAGYSTNTLKAESGATIRTASDVVLINASSTASAALHTSVVDGYFGVTLDQPASFVSNTGPAFNYRFGGVNEWAHNLQATPSNMTYPDYSLAFDWEIPGDVIRVSSYNADPTHNKVIVGAGVGSPRAEGAMFTSASAHTLDAFAGRVSGNSELGAVLTNSGNSTAAGTRVKLISGGDASFAYMTLYNSGHASRALNTYLGVTGAFPLVLATNDTPRIRIGGEGLVNMTAARQSWATVGASVNSSNISADEVRLFIGGASGASLCVRSGGTLYIFGSSISTKG